MLITLSRRAICQSVAEVWLTGVAPLGAIIQRFNFLNRYILCAGPVAMRFKASRFESALMAALLSAPEGENIFPDYRTVPKATV